MFAVHNKYTSHSELSDDSFFLQIEYFQPQIYPQNMHSLLKKIIILQYERAIKTYRSTFIGK